MVNRYTILSKLPSFQNKEVTVVKEQDTTDLINSILKWHKLYQKDYLAIAPYFQGNTQLDTLHNIFDFLKSNIQYFQEPAEKQTLRSPSAIVALAKNDCKNYALFIGGILGALNALGDKFNFVYRFASYSPISKIPGHVFIVVNPGTKKEIWVDPVLDYLNDRNKEPYYFQDKKVSNMIVGISGIGDISFTSTPDFLSSSNSSSPQQGGGSPFGDLFSKGNPLGNLFGGGGGGGNTMSMAASLGENAILPGSGVVLDSLGINSIFTKGGVSPSFFSMFPFLDFLDNSTDHWKSRVSKLKAKTGNEITAWYTNMTQSGGGNPVDLEQFANQWLSKPDPDKVRDITPELDYDIAWLWNKTIDDTYYHGQNTTPGTYVTKQQASFDLSRVNPASLQNSQVLKMIANQKGVGTGTQTSTGLQKKAGLSTFVTIGLVAAAVLFFANKKR